jgi:hypothetical protein
MENCLSLARAASMNGWHMQGKNCYSQRLETRHDSQTPFQEALKTPIASTANLHAHEPLGSQGSQM